MDCVHHWKIETPNGARAGGGWSAGSCIRCGESRKFRNSLPEWDTYGGSQEGWSESEESVQRPLLASAL